MKKFLIAAIAASVLVTPAVAAPQRDYQGNGQGNNRTIVVKQTDRGPHRTVVTKQVVRNDRYQPQRIQQRKWAKGQKFDRRYAQNYRTVNYRQHHLNAPPRGYQWVQSGNDAVLVGIASGLIGAVIGGILR